MLAPQSVDVRIVVQRTVVGNLEETRSAPSRPASARRSGTARRATGGGVTERGARPVQGEHPAPHLPAALERRPEPLRQRAPIHPPLVLAPVAVRAVPENCTVTETWPDRATPAGPHPGSRLTGPALSPSATARRVPAPTPSARRPSAAPPPPPTAFRRSARPPSVQRPSAAPPDRRRPPSAAPPDRLLSNGLPPRRIVRRRGWRGTGPSGGRRPRRVPRRRGGRRCVPGAIARPARTWRPCFSTISTIWSSGHHPLTVNVPGSSTAWWWKEFTVSARPEQAHGPASRVAGR